MTKKSSDQELAHKLKDRDPRAFRELVDEYQSMVLNTCFGFTHRKDQAEDLTQDVFIQVFNSIDKFRAESKLSTWIYRIAVNKSLNHLRKEKNKSWITRIEDLLFYDDVKELATPEKTTPLGILQNSEKAAYLEKAIKKLPENQKTAFTLSKLQGLPNKEVAEVMNLSLSATEALLNRAKKNLQKFLLHYIDII